MRSLAAETSRAHDSRLTLVKIWMTWTSFLADSYLWFHRLPCAMLSCATVLVVQIILCLKAVFLSRGLDGVIGTGFRDHLHKPTRVKRRSTPLWVGYSLPLRSEWSFSLKNLDSLISEPFRAKLKELLALAIDARRPVWFRGFLFKFGPSNILVL